MAKSVLVTAADSGYFTLLRDWVESIRSFPEFADVDAWVLDVGLKEAERDWLATLQIRTVQPGWDVSVAETPNWSTPYKAMTARPYLARYFAQYEIIVWLDADIWVQDPIFLSAYLAGAERYGFAITPEIDRCYDIMFGEYNDLRLLHHSVYYRCFGRAIADRLMQFPVMNSGAFALRREHPIWGEWQKACQRAMQNAALKHSEQAALNFAIYNGPPAHRPHMLPALANWICYAARPMWDPNKEKLVEPSLPHQPLGLVHLTNVLDAVPVLTTSGSKITTAVTYSGIRALRRARE
jgi:hypothetical protein